MTDMDCLLGKDFGYVTYYARDLQEVLGYSSWRAVEWLILRAQSLIVSGEKTGLIEKTTAARRIGSGAIRQVVDYKVDENAFALLCELASGFKLTGHIALRNETVLLRLLRKYCDSKSISFEFQKRVGPYAFDACVGGSYMIEIDEPHHEWAYEADGDATRDALAGENGFTVLRFTLKNDIVDIILAIEAAMVKG